MSHLHNTKFCSLAFDKQQWHCGKTFWQKRFWKVYMFGILVNVNVEQTHKTHIAVKDEHCIHRSQHVCADTETCAHVWTAAYREHESRDSGTKHSRGPSLSVHSLGLQRLVEPTQVFCWALRMLVRKPLSVLLAHHLRARQEQVLLVELCVEVLVGCEHVLQRCDAAASQVLSKQDQWSTTCNSGHWWISQLRIIEILLTVKHRIKLKDVFAQNS